MDGKVDIKCVSTHDIIIYVENPKELTKQLLEQISNSGKVTEYKVDIQMSVVFLYIINKRVKYKIKNVYISAPQN